MDGMVRTPPTFIHTSTRKWAASDPSAPMPPLDSLLSAKTRGTRATRGLHDDPGNQHPLVLPSSVTEEKLIQHKHYWAAFFLRISANCFSRFALARSCSSMRRYFFGKG